MEFHVYLVNCREHFRYRVICVTHVSFPLNFMSPFVLSQYYLSISRLISLITVLITINRTTFRRIIRNKSTEQFFGFPYIYTLLNCFICAWYGTPFVSTDNILLTSVNSIGAIFQLVYLSLFITYAQREKKVC